MKRVVILGASGFVGAAIAKQLNCDQYQVVALTRKECDFSNAESTDILAGIVQDDDIVVCAAAKAPAKNWDMLAENITMITHIADALRQKKLAYVLNISSDAVYGDSMGSLCESSSIAPGAPHGIMHCMREYLLEKNLGAPVGHLRPTLIFGEDDPHNGYGPNSFIRLANDNRAIELFGGGEEQRDHIYIGDVAALACAMIEQQRTGAVNAVSGKTISFMEIAQLVRAAKPEIDIRSKPRSGPMPHNGYRAFTNDAARALCPGLRFMALGDYISNRINLRHAA